MNRIREALSEQRPSFGAWAVLPGSLTAELMGGAGFDWVIVDTQHGGLVVGDLVPLIQALQLGGTPAVVRVPWVDPATIMRVLDFGAAGVMVPMVNTAQDAAAAAAATRYPPDGIRSYGQTRPRYGSTSEANADIVLLVMIETAEALEHVDEIAATPGVDGLFVGAVDLGLSLGLPLDFSGTAPDIVGATDRVVAAAERAGKFAGSISSGPEQAERLVRQGVAFVALGADVGYVRAGLTRDRAAIESLRGVSAGGSRS